VTTPRVSSLRKTRASSAWDIFGRDADSIVAGEAFTAL
jgi:hypothetical protein